MTRRSVAEGPNHGSATRPCGSPLSILELLIPADRCRARAASKRLRAEPLEPLHLKRQEGPRALDSEAEGVSQGLMSRRSAVLGGYARLSQIGFGPHASDDRANLGFKCRPNVEDDGFGNQLLQEAVDRADRATAIRRL